MLKEKIIGICLVALFFAPPIYADRVKDLVDIGGVRSNQLIGYGIVAGLAGTGDGKDLPWTGQSMKSLLSRLGASVDGPVSDYDLGESLRALAGQNANKDIKVENLAAVMVTADLPPFAKPGQRFDVNVSTMGKSSSLRGGTLIMTEMRGIDGQVYGLAQGPLTVTGISADAAGTSVEIGVPTAGRIPNGAIVERAVETPFTSSDHLVLNVRDADFSTTNAIAGAVNSEFGAGTAVAVDGVSVAIRAPGQQSARVAFMSAVQDLEIEPGQPAARVIVNARTGTAVINRSVKLSAAAVSHGTISVKIEADNQVAQAQAFAPGGAPVPVQNADIEVEEQEADMFVFDDSVELQDIVDAINAVGGTPSSLIAILEALKRSGSLKAELIVI